MKAEIISIGTELLLGTILNTNSALLSQRLAGLGIDVYHHITVGDNPSRLNEAIRRSLSRSDIVITTGGLGPTVDDITTETIATLAGKNLILNKVVIKDLRDYFKLRKLEPPPDCARQAYIPEGAKWIRNAVGTAPGLIMEYGGKTIIALPGPPRELGPMFERDIIPYLKTRFESSWTIKSHTIKTTGLAESQVNHLVKAILKLEPPTTVGIYAKLGEVDLRIMTKAKDKRSADKAIIAIEKKIRLKLRGYIFGYDDETLEEAVAKSLIKERKTIAVAESCTGGFLSSRLTNVSGSSRYFVMSVIAYSNASKVNILGVSESDIDKHGAVSRDVAIQMAKGIKRLACVDIGIGITGIAGPGGGTKNKPVGLVYIALVSCRKTLVREIRFRGSREEIKFQASQVALDLLRRTIRQLPS